MKVEKNPGAMKEKHTWLSLMESLVESNIYSFNIISLAISFWVLFFYREEATGVTGSLAIGVAYFGVIESTKKWIEETHVNLRGPWANMER